MAAYRVDVWTSAERYLDRLAQALFQRLMDRIVALGEDPRPADARRLSGAERYRVRVGDYRVIYKIGDDLRVVTITHIGHRRDVYRKLR